LKNKAIVVVSIGNRPWDHSVFSLINRYAEKVDADFFVETEIDNKVKEISLLNQKRKNIHAFTMKSYVVWKYLKTYDQLLVLDDTCCVSPLTPDLFDIVPLGHLGYVTEPKVGKDRFAFLRSKTSNIEYDREHYMNSGVLLYSKEQRPFFSLESIRDNGWTFSCKFPHQAFTYYTSKKNNFKIFNLPYCFNYIPMVYTLPRKERKELKDPTLFVDEKNFIYHVTSAYRHRQLLIEKTCELLEKDI
jgi:lipopolysaccharide biosynthesis glycosyltransferase